MSHLFRTSEETLGDMQQKPSQPENGGNRDAKAEEEGKKDERRSVGFWHKELNSVRLQVFKKWGITTLILTTVVVGILSLYWAVLFNVEKNMSALKIWVVDFDSQVAPYTSTIPLVGPQMVAAAEAMNNKPSHLGWTIKAASEFNFDPLEVRRGIYHERAWAAIIINANATTLLQNAVTIGNTSFDPMGIAQVVYIQARDETTHASYITPMLLEFQTMFTTSFGKYWIERVLSNTTSDLGVLQTTPQALASAVGYSTFNLRPFTPATATPSITIGLIYLIIISFYSFSFYLPIHMFFVAPHPSRRILHFYQLILWRIIATIAAYFILSLFYSLISLAFQVPFSASPGSEVEVVSPATRYGRASFVVYWMLNWVGMTALGLACENVGMVVGFPWTAFWLIFWVITNVATSFYNLDLAPGFYAWGLAWPLHNIVEASRTILFDTHSKIGLNFGVLFAWCAVNIALFPLACWFMRWKQQRQNKKETEKESEK